MNQGKYVFSQLMSFVSHNDFIACVHRYNGDYKVKDFTCWKQFLCMAFGQLTHRESLSDTILCLSRLEGKLYHLGIGKAVSKSTLSKANENRDWRIYADLAQLLIAQAKQLYANDSALEVNLKQNVFAIDATVIDLCLNLFPWAKFRRAKAAVKLTTQLNLKNAIPEFIAITSASIHEVKLLDEIEFESDSFYIMDRGYIDFRRLYRIHLLKAFFVIRGKNNFKCKLIHSGTVDKSSGVKCDQTVRLKNEVISKLYPEKFRRIKFYDLDQNRHFVFLTNNFEIKATEIAQLYKHRWMIEIFFKWIKQHLKIKSFWGNSINAVRTQIWIAISVYVLIAIIKKQFEIKQSLYEMLQVLSITVFEKTPINHLFQDSLLQNFNERNRNQLSIFE
jgi:IS4 transposase